MNITLIIAGGSGHRMGAGIPKQFIEIDGKPLIMYTLERFQENDLIDDMYVVCVDGYIKYVDKLCRDYNINKVRKICVGGRTGLESVRNGLSTINAHDDDLILIHDAVRPFIDYNTIKENICVAKRYGCAVTAVDCFETLVKSTDGISSTEIISRDNLKRVLTPQTFRYDVLKNLFADVDFDRCELPSTFALYMSNGNQIYYSGGNSMNIKITYPSDITFCRAVLPVYKELLKNNSGGGYHNKPINLKYIVFRYKRYSLCNMGGVV